MAGVPRDKHGNPRVQGPQDVAPVRLLWRDFGAFALDKPSGLLCHNSAFAGRPEWTLTQAAEQLLGFKPRLVHRLDRGTSGLVLATEPDSDGAAWQQALQAGTKTYLGLVRGRPLQTLYIDHAVRSENGDRQEAQTTLEPLLHSEVDRCSLVKLTLHTGRWRQARQHVRHANHPLIGDGDHGQGAMNRDYAAKYALERLALHAWRLELQPPGQAAPLTLHCALPEDLYAPLLRLFAEEDLQRLQVPAGESS